MARHAEQVLKEALQLPEADRAELICGLIDSFGAPKSSERTDEEWITEIERRARAAIAGEPGIPWDEVRAAVKRRIGDE